MRIGWLNRRFHYWLAFVIALPLLVVILSGLLLQVKKDVPWVQPVENRGSGKEPQLSFEQILAACRMVPEAEISSWGDIDRVDIRPAKGMLKITARNSWEVQIDIVTGAVLQSAYRRSDLIESLHDGSFFSPVVKRWVFLPSGIILLVLWVTGMMLWVQPRWIRWRRGHVGRDRA